MTARSAGERAAPAMAASAAEPAGRDEAAVVRGHRARSKGSAGPLERWAPAALAAAALAGLALPRMSRRPVWIDEALTIGATAELARTWRGTGGTMALYYLLMWPVTQISTGRVWVRLPSLLFAALTVVVVHEVGRLIGGRRMGAFAAGTLAATWPLSRYAVEARSYTLALLLVSAGWLGLVGAVRATSEEERRRWWRMFVVATLLAPLAHGLAALSFAGQVAAVSLAPDRRRWFRACIPIGLVLAAEGVALFAVGAGEVAGWIEPLQWSQVRSLLHVLFGLGPALWVIGALAVAGAARALADRRRHPGTEGWLRMVPLFWAAGTPLALIALSTVRPYAEGRYVLSAVPGVALLVAGLLVRVRPVRLAVVAWIVVAVALLSNQYRVMSDGIEDWPALTARIAIDGQDGDRVLTTEKLRAAFDYAWAEQPGRPDLEPLSPTDPLGQPRRFYDAAPGTLRSVLMVDPVATVWYVDRHGSRRDEVDALLSDPEIAQRYLATGPWVFRGELYLVMFEPRPS